MGSLLETHNLTKLFGIVIGVNDLTLSLEPGVHGLLGPNGAGKSTFLKLLTAQLRPSEGTVRVFGENPWNNPELFRRIGLCPEHDRFYRGMTARDFVESLARIGGIDAQTASRRTVEVLEICGATDFMDRRIETYSKGMRQRTKVAQALVHDPEFIILDEPLSGTDPVGRHELTELVIELGRQGKSILVASHVLHEVQAMTRQFLLIYRGRVLASGDVGEIRSLMNEFPHRIRLRCEPERVSALAAGLLEQLGVSGVTTDVATGEIEASTVDPERFYRDLPAISLERNATLYELSSDDDNLESVFKYLVGARA